jgi:excisionase family DNA binding protein
MHRSRYRRPVLPRVDIEPALLSVEETARYLRVSRTRAYQLAREGQLPGLVRLGGMWRVSRRALERWVDEIAQK